MQYRQLGRSGLKVSPICLGTMMFGGPTDEAASQRIIAKAHEAGINFIDAGQIGELLIAKPRVVRVTHTLIFTTAEVVAEGRVVATASGVFKILKDNS